MIPADTQPRTVDAHIDGLLLFRRTHTDETTYYTQKHGERPTQISESEYQAYISEAAKKQQNSGKTGRIRDNLQSLIRFQK